MKNDPLSLGKETQGKNQCVLGIIRDTKARVIVGNCAIQAGQGRMEVGAQSKKSFCHTRSLGFMLKETVRCRKSFMQVLKNVIGRIWA